MRQTASAVARLRAVLGPDLPDLGQSLAALGISLLASLVAGLTLGAITDTLEDLPGLLVLVPAAIGLRGTSSAPSAPASARRSTPAPSRVSGRADTVVGQNVLAAARARRCSHRWRWRSWPRRCRSGFGLDALDLDRRLRRHLGCRRAASSSVVVMVPHRAVGRRRRCATAGTPTTSSRRSSPRAGDMVTLPALSSPRCSSASTWSRR